MELQINNKITISELQKQFGAEFPYLKIEFFSIPHSSSKRLSKTYIFPISKTLGSCGRLRKEGVIHITPADTVEKLEKIFRDEFGLSAEVFRKSGNLWIETSLSNSWTLKLQNEEGKALSDTGLNSNMEDEYPNDRDKWQ